MRIIISITCFLFLITFCPLLGQIPGQNLFDNSEIHELKISSLYEALPDTLSKNYLLSFGFGQTQIRKIPYAPALITIDGTVLDTIGIRYKGFNSWWNSVKKPIKIDLNRYKGQQEYDGLSKFNLHNGSGDPSFIRENISYKILRSMGIKAPRTAFAKVFIDDVYIGLYRIVEQVDNTFLDVNFGDHEGNLYVQQSKGSGGFVFDWRGSNQENYYEALELENHQKENDWSSLIHFMDVLNHAPDASFKNEILAVFDVHEYLEILAFDLAINNLDWYGSAGRNYYIVEVDDKFHWLPWDYNLSWREDARPININPDEFPLLIKRILSVPEFYRSFLRKYCELLPYFSENSFNILVDNEVTAIQSLMQVDPYLDYPYEAFETNTTATWENIVGLKEFASQRYADITSTLEAFHFDCSLITDLPEEQGSTLKIYPVPAGDVLYVETCSEKKLPISILNSLGQVILQAETSDTNPIDVSQLQPGIYVLRISIVNEESSRLFLITR